MFLDEILLPPYENATALQRRFQAAAKVLAFLLLHNENYTHVALVSPGVRGVAEGGVGGSAPARSGEMGTLQSNPPKLVKTSVFNRLLWKSKGRILFVTDCDSLETFIGSRGICDVRISQLDEYLAFNTVYVKYIRRPSSGKPG